MKPRGTINYISPDIYVLYVLKLRNNLGPEQILTAWKDHLPLQIQFYYSDTPYLIVRELLEKALNKFWSINQAKPITKAQSVIKFAKKYSPKRLVR